MARRIIDLSIPIANDIPADPPIQIPAITYIDHTQSLDQIISFFPGLKAEDLPDRAGCRRVLEIRQELVAAQGRYRCGRGELYSARAIGTRLSLRSR